MLILNCSKYFIVWILLTGIILGSAPDPVRGKNGMVVSSSKISSLVGAEILKKGGNAVDAAVAVGFALAVTYHSAGNIGGGGFMVIHLKDGKNTTIDFRETAPLKAFRDMYLNKKGNYDSTLSSEGVTSTGVPGSVAGLIYALDKYGTMKLKDVIQPAIDLAENGFILEHRVAETFINEKENFYKYPSSRKVFFKDGKELYGEGELMRQPDLAKTLRLIRDNGKDGFYKGETARLIIKQIELDGGYITQKDLDEYKPLEREPVKGKYRGYEIVSMPPPSSGGIALIEMLNVLENYKFKKDDWGSSSYIHKLVETMKFAYADRTEYLGDADFVKVPVKQLMSKKYAKSIFDIISDNVIPSAEIKSRTYKNFHESEPDYALFSL